MSKTIKENASAGSVGASSIAVNMDHSHSMVSRPTGAGVGSHRKADHDWNAHTKADKEQREKDDAFRAHARKQLERAKEIKAEREKAKKRRSFSDFFRKRVNEEFDLGSVVANLKGIENAGKDQVSDVVSYGIEDDKGNFMRVSVKADQAKEFEMTLARKMADNKDDAAMGVNMPRTSLAEILFDLQNQFNIVDVEFPIIPKDAVYNASDATINAGQQPPMFSPDNNQFDDIQTDENDMDMSTDDSLNSEDQDFENGEESLDTTGIDNDLDGGNVEDFGNEETSSTDPTSILQSLVDMLKKQAEAETAKANAAAEQARATQAEWSALAADKEVQRAEELARVQADVQEKKRKEKMAKQYADLAKYNVTQGKSALNNASGFGESIETSLLYSSLLEDQYDNVNALQKAKVQIMDKYKINQTDDTATKTYKSAAQRLELGIIDQRIQLVKLNQAYQSQEQTQQTQQNNQQTQQQSTQPNQATQATQQTNNNGSLGNANNGGI